MKKILLKENILQAGKSLANEKRKDWLTGKEFVKETGIPMSQVHKYWDRWNDSVREAGLKPISNLGRPDTQRGYLKEDLIDKARLLAFKMGRDYLSESKFTREVGISAQSIYRLFSSWQQFAKEAGLKIHPAHKIKIPNTNLFQKYLRIADELIRFPTYHEFARRSTHSIGVFENRFGNSTGFRKHALQYGVEKRIDKT